jgi:hypothetical protein
MAAPALPFGAPRALGGTLIAGALVAITLAHAQGQPHRVAPTTAPHHTAVTIQRASATAAGEIARPAPLRPVLLAGMPQHDWGQQGGGEHHHGHHGGGG